MQENMRRRYNVPPSCSCGARYNVTPQTRQEVPGSPDCPNMMLAMAYVKSQTFENLYSPEEAWRNGTLFADINLPYTGGKNRC